MWDLTIPGDHDFYIDTTAEAVLVHNCAAALSGRDIVEQTARAQASRGAPELLGTLSDVNIQPHAR